MIKYTDGYKYQLYSNYECNVDIYPTRDIKILFITLLTSGVLKIRKGYAWDGPSGPTFDTATFMRGSLIHDALYQLIRLNHLSCTYREQADKELKKACLEDGMSKIRAWLIYRAVKRFAGFAVKCKKEVFTAPKETE